MEEKGKGNEMKRTLTFLIAFINCFCTSDFKHLSITVWCNSVLALRCLVHIPKFKPVRQFFFSIYRCSSIRKQSIKSNSHLHQLKLGYASEPVLPPHSSLFYFSEKESISQPESTQIHRKKRSRQLTVNQDKKHEMTHISTSFFPKALYEIPPFPSVRILNNPYPKLNKCTFSLSTPTQKPKTSPRNPRN